MGIKLHIETNEMDFIVGLLQNANLPWVQTNPVIVKLLNQANDPVIQSYGPPPKTEDAETGDGPPPAGASDNFPE